MSGPPLAKPPTGEAAALPRLLNCPKCRTPVAPETTFCYGCGLRIDSMASVDRPRPAGSAAPRRRDHPCRRA